MQSPKVASHGDASPTSREDEHSSLTAEPRAITPARLQFLTIMLTLYMTMFLVALDKTIIGVAIPTITDDFHSLDNIGWYGSAYMLSNASVQLLFGRIYKFNAVKAVFMSSVLIFEVGSAVCGSAQGSTSLVIGRSIAGAGAAGISSGCIQIMLTIVPLHERPTYQAFFGVLFGVSSAVGPILGGVLTTKTTWRWCFYVNLPVGAMVLLVIHFLLNTPQSESQHRTPWVQQIKRLDPLGFLLSAPSIVCLLLALQYGGTTYAWSDSRLIALWIVSGLTLVAFVASQWYAHQDAILPPTIVGQSTVFGSICYSFLLAGSMTLMVYYIPIWFQVTKGSSALESSYQTLPSILPLVIASIFAGLLARKTGYYAPQMVAAPIISSIGIGLISTWDASAGAQRWIGYQILYGFGLGLGMQGPSLAVQASLKGEDVPIGIAAIFFFQQIGSAIFVSVGQNLLLDSLIANLTRKKVPGADAGSVAKAGATQLRNMVKPEYLPAITNIYNVALRSVWYAALGLTCAISVSLPFIKWHNLQQVSLSTKSDADSTHCADQNKEKTNRR